MFPLHRGYSISYIYLTLYLISVSFLFSHGWDLNIIWFPKKPFFLSSKLLHFLYSIHSLHAKEHKLPYSYSSNHYIFTFMDIYTIKMHNLSFIQKKTATTEGWALQINWKQINTSTGHFVQASLSSPQKMVNNYFIHNLAIIYSPNLLFYKACLDVLTVFVQHVQTLQCFFCKPSMNLYTWKELSLHRVYIRLYSIHSPLLTLN
jgi:hypothetical protein